MSFFHTALCMHFINILHFDFDFLDYCLHLYCAKPFFGLLQVYLVYLSIGMIQSLTIDQAKCSRTHEEFIQIMISLFLHIYQSEKHHEMFHKKHHEKNLKRQIQWYQLFLVVLIFRLIYFNLAFSVICSHILFISILGPLKRSA